MSNSAMKVLWIEDIKEIHDTYRMEAEPYGLFLSPYTNWEEAKKELLDDYDKWSAIILDAKCKLTPTSPDKASSFLPQVLSDLSGIYAEKKRVIPWFVLSAGGAEIGQDWDDFITSSRLAWDADWPKKYYSKNTDRQSLYDRITKKASVSNTLQLKTIFYRDLFETISELSLDKEVEVIMTKLLLPIHFNEDAPVNYNDLYPRCNKVLEHVFRSMIDHGILPPSIGNKSGKGDLNLAWASMFLSGRKPDVSRKDNPNNSKFEIRKTVFPVVVSKFVEFICKATGSEKHTGKRSEKDVYDMKSYLDATKNSPYLLRSIAYQLVDFILWYKDYLNKNPDKQENECYWEEKP